MPRQNDRELEEQYGYFSPNEISQLTLSDEEKARIAQLQIHALGEIGLNMTELQSWIAIYTQALGDTDYL